MLTSQETFLCETIRAFVSAVRNLLGTLVLVTRTSQVVDFRPENGRSNVHERRRARNTRVKISFYVILGEVGDTDARRSTVIGPPSQW